MYAIRSYYDLGGGWRVRVSGERRAVTDSLLSWSGQRDALTGQTWGGVVRTGGRAQVEYGTGAASFYAGGGYAVFEGSDVKDNNRIEFGAGGEISGWTATPFDMEGKREGLEALARQIGTTPDRCAFVGDHLNDRITSYNVCYTKLLRVSSGRRTTA